LYEVMREIKPLFDPAGMLNPGVILNDDRHAHIRHIKWAPVVEPAVDRCVECGFCEPVCPSRDLTTTPRQRIVVRRALAHARAERNARLVAELENAYEYDGVQTCAVDGMCQTACPVAINTGDLIKRLRAESDSCTADRARTVAARHWSGATRAASAALTAAGTAPAPVVRGPNRLARRALGAETVPLWSEDLPSGGRRRGRPAPGAAPSAVYLPACVNAIFGPAGGGAGVQHASEALCERAGITLLVRAGVDALCCGNPWSSKGHNRGAELIKRRVREALMAVSDGGRLPVICDASSCTEGLVHALGGSLRVLDAVEFVATDVLPRLPDVADKLPVIALHPTCSSARLGLDAALADVAATVAGQVFRPTSWGCCAFAGDSGMLHPELTASATRQQAAEITAVDAAAHASCNRTCEIGITRATGRPYRHVLEILAELLGRGADNVG
jgi:D-lactate dehydrogenase